ncbi:hypothetical protein THTE_3404 [Thermogutta terrifontis]|uniref:Uncharacterized protein n=1 Tax=Thermogutta terrifontis TaxID=1331910 RepID=A0A286RJ75_9BACT|nr:hypothetical protein THTE_3404 [Thermogutta terrifontis]
MTPRLDGKRRCGWPAVPVITVVSPKEYPEQRFPEVFYRMCQVQ